MTLGEMMAVLGAYPGDENLFKLPVLVHTPGAGAEMVPAEVYLLTNEETGERCLHLDAAQKKEEVQ